MPFANDREELMTFRLLNVSPSGWVNRCDCMIACQYYDCQRGFTDSRTAPWCVRMPSNNGWASGLTR
ncbi:hypothetical protein BN2476_510045 [Paraburkholderia piptadeniae]|uniref:Uncharacterized protein n=1 Tax=Paraburkholderia piptadeniae TaxID=1701573 RepID=A0A1N7SGM8_9BURK|nr:hypothetical protein BN2476_510045 [Paraburkholderia piptadeniae]